MYKKVLLTISLFSLLLTSQVHAALYCSGVPVKINAASSAGFHNFSETGITGSTIFMSVPAESCTDNDGNEIATKTYLVIDNLTENNELKSVWISMLMSAEARGTNINFHAYNLGINSRGFQVLRPYFITEQ